MSRGRDLWRWAVVALSTLILCSCRAPTAAMTKVDAAGSTLGFANQQTPAAESPQAEPAIATAGDAAVVQTSATSVPTATYTPTKTPAIARDGAPCACQGQLPLPYNVCATSCHPDELLCDGGDAPPGVMVSPDWKIYGLNAQDTIAHFDTLDGRTLVKKSNCVCIYAPRFGAVRSVSRVAASQQIDVPTGMVKPEQIVRHEEVVAPVSSLQRWQAKGDVATRGPEAFVRPEMLAPVSTVLIPVGVQDNFLPYENLELIKRGVFDNAEKARLAQAIQAAIVWSREQAPQVTIEGVAAVPLTHDVQGQITYTVEDRRHCPCLRVIKVASTQTAKPGDIVDFTIRFDNVGDQPLGNIVLVDNLVTRLEYVPDSAKASVPATFTTQPSESESVVLRWELTQPLEVGQGGLVRFRCKVR